MLRRSQNVLICQDRGHATFLPMVQSQNFFQLFILEGFQKGNQLPPRHGIDILILVQIPACFKTYICKNRSEYLEVTSNSITYACLKKAKSSFIFSF